MNDRVRDSGEIWVDLLSDDVLVRCPRCDGLAVVVLRSTTGAGSSYGTAFAGRRLSCGACGSTRDWDGDRIAAHRDGRDPYFGLPLWLRATCAGGRLLWAYNARHLDLLERYVTARLRERDLTPRGPATMAERLPAWMKSARNREGVLRAVNGLRRTLPG